MPLVSIIVPVYKVEPYLHRCVDSILAQTFTDFELILVDDGSPDNCGAICDEYAAKDNRIHAIHQENGGLSAARNAGLRISSGKYISFIDSDDYILSNLLEIVIPYMEDGDDLVAFGYYKFNDAGIIGKASWNNQSWVLTGENRCSFLIEQLLQYKIGWEAWSRVYKKEILDLYSLEFEDNNKIFAEDLYFCLCYCSHAKKIRSIDNALYYYYVRPCSIMGIEKNNLNASRMNELGKAVEKHYKSTMVESEVIDAFPAIYYLIMDNVFSRFLRTNSMSIQGFRKIIRSDIVDFSYFSRNMKNIRKCKRYLKFKYSRYLLEERIDTAEYYADGKLVFFRLKCIINIFISKMKKYLGGK